MAQALRNQGSATLLLDLLTAREVDVDRFTNHLRFDVGLLAARPVAVAGWLAADQTTTSQPIGLFGSGGGAALVAAAERPDRFRAVVLRGGRPALAGIALDRVEAPSLFLVGALAPLVAELNERAMARVRASKKLEVIAGASHLFDEPAALEEVVNYAAGW